MLEKIKNIFKEKDEKKRTENLIAFLIILVVTLILINKILKDDSKANEGISQNQTGIELVSGNTQESDLVNSDGKDELERRLEGILSKISGVRKS